MIFPNEYENKEHRINLWKQEVDRYLGNEKLKRVFELFGFTMDEKLSFENKLKSIHQFTSANWDFRKKAAENKSFVERAAVIDRDEIVMENKELILEMARSLGLIKTGKMLYPQSDMKYDYVLPLGGYRAATSDRILFSDHYNREKMVVLTAERKIDDIEKPYLNHVPDAVLNSGTCTEYITAKYCVKNILGMDEKEEHIYDEGDSQGMIQEYNDEIFVLCAPTPSGARRANTLQTLEFLLEKFDLKAKDSVLCVTSPIYSSYQIAALANFFIENDLLFALVPCGECNTVNAVVSNYLQEVKGTVDMFYQFFCKEK